MADAWGANTLPVRKYNSEPFTIKVRKLHFWFFRRFPRINVGGDSAHFPPLEDASREPCVTFPPKGRLRQYINNDSNIYSLILGFYHKPTMAVTYINLYMTY